MIDYLLFVDTETSGIPQDWHQPYAAEDKWPVILQIAWLVYSRDGRKIKTETHYIRPYQYRISPESEQVHGLTPAFLQEHGQERAAVLQLLHDDLARYQPLVVGHFMELDFHMIGVGFHRVGLDNPLLRLPTFCTMKVTERFMLPTTAKRYLRLPELYQRLFNEPMVREHEALTDAYATALSFFELWRRGDITEQTIEQQQRTAPQLPTPRPPRRVPGPVLWLLLAAAAAGLLLVLFMISAR